MSDFSGGQPGVFDVASLQPFVNGLPTEEEEAGLLLIFQLIQLNEYVNEFTGAVTLLDFCELERPKYEAVDPKRGVTIEINRTRYTLKALE